MCFKKWFTKPDPVVIENEMVWTKLRMLTFGRNAYGGGNDLRGCINDSIGLTADLKSRWPAFDVKMFTDYDVTANAYLKNGAKAISLLKPEATVLMLLDSCYSQTATRALNNEPNTKKGRFIELENLPLDSTRDKEPVIRPSNNYIAISACLEHETAADAYIGSQYVGAFTYYLRKSLEKGMTYKEWFDKVREYLPSHNFSQTPTIEGPDFLLDRRVFEDETLVIHNSSHGSYVRDRNDDEEDKFDEVLYFDRSLLDDEIQIMLSKIPQ